MSSGIRWGLAAAWGLVVVALVAHAVSFFNQPDSLDTDVRALLPTHRDDPVRAAALGRMAEAVSDRVVVLVGGGEWAEARLAGDAAAVVLQERGMRVRYRVGAEGLADVANALRPHRDRLLTEAQRAQFEAMTADGLAQEALGRLMMPMGPEVMPWTEDPLGMLEGWLRERGQTRTVHPTDGRLAVFEASGAWAFLDVALPASASSWSADDAVMGLVDAVSEAVLEVAPSAEVHAAGTPLHAAAAVKQGRKETSTIGVVSLLGVLLLMVMAFRSPWPILLVGASIVVGTLAGLWGVHWVFGRVHVTTLVFGASLVGVAEDYGIHWFTTRQADPEASAPQALQAILPALWLALGTSVAGYAVFALAPLPGLRQIAVFSGLGLAGAFATVLAWFPVFGARPIRGTALSAWWGSTRQRWRLPPKVRAVLLMLTSVGVLMGLGRLETRDELRSLVSAPPELREAERRAAELLGRPSPIQFFLVHGETEDEVLVREEVLGEQLDLLVAEHVIGDHWEIASMVPSSARQRSNAAWVANTRQSLWRALEPHVGPVEPSGVKTYAAPWTVSDAIRSPLGHDLSTVWLGQHGATFAGVVQLSGLSPASLPSLAALAGEMEGVRFVDEHADASALLGRYRRAVSGLFIVSLMAVWVLLARRFGRSSWRVLAPVVLGIALGVASLGWAGVPMNFFHVAAALVSLGMGVDYGILLLEHPEPADGAPWVAIGLGATSTVLAFGMLAFSATPALAAFGWMLTVGVTVSWLTAPWFCDSPTHPLDG